MTKVSQILGILNMLYSRDYVTLREIVEHCKVSKRTVYRYMNTIAEANIPVQFDNQRRAYSLTSKVQYDMSDLRLDQILLIGFGFSLIAPRLNHQQNEIITETWHKIASHQASFAEWIYELVCTARTLTETGTEPPQTTNYLICEVAAALGKSVTIEVLKSDDIIHKQTISRPSLRFSRTWRLRDLSSERGMEYDLGKILSVKCS